MHYTFPHGVSMGQGQHVITYEDALKLTEGASDVHKVLAQNAPNRRRGRPKQVASKLGDDTHFARGGSKNKSKATLSARLAQEKPKFYDAYLNGTYKSVNAAATAAGPMWA